MIYRVPPSPDLPLNAKMYFSVCPTKARIGFLQFLPLTKSSERDGHSDCYHLCDTGSLWAIFRMAASHSQSRKPSNTVEVSPGEYLLSPVSLRWML